MTSYWSIPLFICLVVELCASQPTSTSCNTCSKVPICNGCTLNADVITTSSTSWDYHDPAIGTPYLQAYIHITAYTVTSRSLVKGTCVQTTGSPVTLIDPYVVSVKPLLVYNTLTILGDMSFVPKDAAAITAGYSVFLEDAYSSLDATIGYEGCTAAVPPSPVVPTLASQLYGIVASATTSTVASATAGSSVPVQHNHTTQIIIVSVVLPTAGLMILLLCFIAIRRYRKKRSQAVVMNHATTTTDTQLYVDRKAELEDEERRKHELNGAGKSYEMEGEDRVFEMPSGRDEEMSLASIRETQELRGVDHSQELEVPGTAF